MLNTSALAAVIRGFPLLGRPVRPCPIGLIEVGSADGDRTKSTYPQMS
ncbi:hypothetical protein VA596_47155 [Amycolatopsis sp., V23-08]|uniref:Uncharacterized protein n=1 Tax=Amycolatopsis heterodermiae TaxID=3110235 RepID=A0ABU5RLK8_9PSEU|nr:hypothetical protein [Amycolatopsis sp., V23-08]MEA5367177.1 hypothetical protein [Amycolatopsis sp., V23-08]